MARQHGYATKREEIARAAWTLFIEEGYRDTPVDKIIRTAGISKGTLYHYFPTKRELLDHAVDTLFHTAWLQVRVIAMDSEISPVAKLNAITHASLEWREANPDAMWQFLRTTYSQGNLLLRRTLDARTVESVAPNLALILTEGVEEGVFTVNDPYEVSALLLRLANTQREANAHDLMAEDDREAILTAVARRLDLFVECTERILAAQPGSLDRPDKSFLAPLLAAKTRAQQALQQP